jgi:O6-methylguanine-DNA--protein-cysteine methyltransferase
MTENAAKTILEDAHHIINDARERADKIICEANSAKEVFVKLAIACIATILTAIIVVSINFHNQKIQGERVDKIWRDYTPLQITNDLQENQQFMVLDIVSQLNGDKDKAREISTKYIEFQKRVINRLSEIRGGMTTTTRSYHPMQEPTNGGSN